MEYSSDVDVASLHVLASSMTLFQDFCKFSKKDDGDTTEGDDDNTEDEDDTTDCDDDCGGVSDLDGLGNAEEGVGVLNLAP